MRVPFHLRTHQQLYLGAERDLVLDEGVQHMLRQPRGGNREGEAAPRLLAEQTISPSDHHVVPLPEFDLVLRTDVGGQLARIDLVAVVPVVDERLDLERGVGTAAPRPSSKDEILVRIGSWTEEPPPTCSR